MFLTPGSRGGRTRPKVRQKVVKTDADFSVTSSVALADVPGLLAQVEAGRTYRFSALLFVKSMAVAGGTKAAIAGSCTAIDIRYEGYVLEAGATPLHGYAQATALAGAVADQAATTNTIATIYIRGTITVNTAGNLRVQFAQNTSNVTASVVARGGIFLVEDIT